MSQQATAVTSQSIRIVSNQPVVAAQFNPPSNKDFGFMWIQQASHRFANLLS